MPPYSTAVPVASRAALHQCASSTLVHSQHCEDYGVRQDDAKAAPPQDGGAVERTTTGIAPAITILEGLGQDHRLEVKTHIFKKELQEYIPTRVEDRLRIETIVYAELSIVKQNDNSLVKLYDYVSFPMALFHVQPEKVMAPEEMATKRILRANASVLCPSNNWREETEACVRCARRMSAKREENENRIMHILPELYRTENGDALINFRSGIANIQFKINCYCGHKKEKEGFIVRFDPQTDVKIASHSTLPLMFYHQNKKRMASRALAAVARAQAKAEKLMMKQEAARARSAHRSGPRQSKHGRHHDPVEHCIGQIPSPPASSASPSSIGDSVSPELRDLIDNSDTSFDPTAPSQSVTEMASLFPEISDRSSLIAGQSPYQQAFPSPVAAISHMTPDSGPTRGGTLVTIHGSDFSVGEMMYVCFGQTFVPVIPQHREMLECFTPAWIKAETVSVFIVSSTAPSSAPPQSTFTYVDDNEKELVKLALQRIMNVSARMDGPLESVMSRANELLMWSDLLGGPDSFSGTSTSTPASGTGPMHSNLEDMIVDSFKMLDTPVSKSINCLSMTTKTGHTMLHLSVALGFKRLARDLIDRGIDVKIRDKNGHDAVDLARLLHADGMLEALLPTTMGVNESAKSTRSDSRSNAIPGALVQEDHQDSSETGGSALLRLKVSRISERSRQHHDLQLDFQWGSTGLSDRRNRSLLEEEELRRHVPTITPLSLQRGSRDDRNAPVFATPLEAELQRHRRMGSSSTLGSLIDSSSAPNNSTQETRRTAPDDNRRMLRDLESFTSQNHDRLLQRNNRDFCNERVPVTAFLLSEGGRAVTARRRSDGNEGGSEEDAAEQVAVRSNRDDVESEPVLFLGGRPVVRRTTRATSSNPRQERESSSSSDATKDADMTNDA
ncbi:SPT3 Dosage dependent suppressor of Ty-induced promoter mutations-like protein [Dissophora globulifera]|uniref:SPT3 Dosage dependent suppressor of Ty-induced promoter mutations-like protein n=1 Tax=Dissophora globulifera TaxID=979702 RepID=A0A9P6RS99_9FUNG|nr:SPT3 Dosage dependent suppressor of Ty-induced promoter mutations-like protein [Dissophora globulifera]